MTGNVRRRKGFVNLVAHIELGAQFLSPLTSLFTPDVEEERPKQRQVLEAKHSYAMSVKVLPQELTQR